MNRKSIVKLSLLVVLVLLTLVIGSADAGLSVQAATIRDASRLTTPVLSQHEPRPIVRFGRNGESPPVRSLPTLPPVVGEVRELPRKTLPNRVGSSGPSGSDPVLQESTGSSTATIGLSFEGVNNVNGVLPPDPNGDVGPKHYVQMVNLSFAIWQIDRSTNTATLAHGPIDNNSLWQGFGGPCETTNDGDPIVLYDHLADRWLMSQFALPRFPLGPFYQCIAVSQTGDPTGSWHLYEFKISDKKMNDYPKFGVWPDAYYMAVNQFKQGSLRWGGQGVVAFERDKMLNGDPARMVYFDLESVDSNLGGMLPSDLNGPEPPTGSPNFFVQMDDDAWGYSPDQLQIWEFHVDWADPTISTFTRAALLGTAAFDSNMCGYSRNCIPQPGGTDVDAISDRLMYRLQYRNFSGQETMVVNHTVDVDGADHAGIRWYELRNEGSGWSIYQQGTYAPDSDHRWMGSVAMNSAGDIALGYSVSSGTTYPSIGFTGRLAGDPLDQMTQGEGEIIAGSGYQEHSSGRWGDYSMMAVDPVDDCTFWYTQEYYEVVGTAPWQTRIGSFKLSECSPVDNPPSVSIVNPADGSTVSGAVTIQVDATDAEDATGTLTVEVSIDGGAWQNATYNSTSGYYELNWDTTVETEGSHTIDARTADSANNTTNATQVTVNVDNVDDPPTASIVNPADGSTVSGTVTIQVDATDDRDAEGTLTVEVSIDSGAWQGTTYNSSSGYYELDWDTTTVADGSHTIDARATDSGSNTTNAAQVTVTVDNTAPPGNENDIYVWDISFSQKDYGPGGSFHDLMTTVTVQRDSDASGTADSTDERVADASVSMTLTYDSDGDGIFECGTDDSCWNFGGTTDSNGQVTFTLKRASTGNYEALVTNITHTTYTYNATLDVDNPDYYNLQ